MAKSRASIEGAQFGEEAYKEGEVASGATIYPGMVLEITGTNGDGDPLLAPVSTVDKPDAAVRVALTPTAPPKGNDADEPREHEYSAGEVVQYQVFRSGDTIQNGLLADGTALATSSNATVSPGDTLGTNDDGTLKATSTAGAGIAEALESADNSGGSGTSGGVSAKRLEYEVV